ncbi:MAG: HAMP domain-containing protein [Pseudomonadales bacterium]|nr:HAMP domain-containing protein [Pseudomonadales bacterium]
MSLRRQLLVIVLLTLALPWAGCQYIKELEITLRDNTVQGLQEIARSVSQQLSPAISHSLNTTVSVHAFDLKTAGILDGYDDEWQSYIPQRFEVSPLAKMGGRDKTVSLVAGVFHRSLYLFLSVPDNTTNYYNPTLSFSNGDRVLLHFFDARDERHTITLNTSAPGAINVGGTNASGTNTRVIKMGRGIEGSWQDTESGYNLEITLPLSALADELQIEIVDAQDSYTSSRYLLPKGRVVLPRPKLKRIVNMYAGEQRRLLVIDQQAWLLAESDYPSEGSASIYGNLSSEVENSGVYEKTYEKENDADQQQSWRSLLSSLLNQCYRFILSDEYLPREGLHDRGKGQLIQAYISPLLQGGKQGLWQQYRLAAAIVTAAYPIFGIDESNKSYVAGAIIIEQDSEAILSVSNQAISRLFGISFLVIGMITLALLFFATIISSRINQLSLAAAQVISPEGEFSVQIKASKIRDEIGDLSRSFVTMQNRLGEYTHYLKSLSGKLSHELRTPLAMVRTSLENLEQSQSLDDDAKVYMQRAKDGLERLRHIVTAMSEATRVEQSISSAEMETVELCEILRNLVATYQSSNKGKNLVTDISDDPVYLQGNTELLAQMLDKLFENAAEFTPQNGSIRFLLEKDTKICRLVVSNDGPLLPETMQNQLFDSLVSIRDKAQGKTHLGFGLFIVKLIVEFHGGQVSASNRVDLSGVEFEVQLPVVLDPEFSLIR